MSEVRPIDANALLKKGKYSQHIGNFIPLTDIENAPILDYEPVIHAHWIRVSKNPNKGKYKFQCSNCKWKIHYSDLYGVQVDNRRCRNCGAKMDEEVKKI